MKKVLIAFVRVYQMVISPLAPGRCRFFPSCSQYAIDSISKHGSLKGTFLSLKRVAKCHPFHPGGYDPA